VHFICIGIGAVQDESVVFVPSGFLYSVSRHPVGCISCYSYVAGRSHVLPDVTSCRELSVSRLSTAGRV